MFGLFVPTPDKLRAKQLAEAERSLIDYQRGKEYHDAMVAMLTARVATLKKELGPVPQVPFPDVPTNKGWATKGVA